MMRNGTRSLFLISRHLGMTALLGSLCAAQPETDAGAVSRDKVSLPVLTALVIEHDPTLEALRGAIADADFRVATAARGRDPEVRVHYGSLDGWSVPSPYTETTSEVISERGSAPYTRETTSRVTPDRTGETVQETVAESGSLSRESIGRRAYGRDVYSGRSSYTVQLRLFPRNPFLGSAARNRETATRAQAKLTLDTSLQRAALSVAREHREIQFMLAELKVMRRRADVLRTDLARLSELNTAFGINPADYHRQRTQALLHFTRLNELKTSIADAAAALKIRAGLGASDHISFAGHLAPPTVDFGNLDAARLRAVALERNPELGAVQTAGATLESDIATHRAERIPWLSAVSLDYGTEDANNGLTRDEWGVYAGVNLPVGSWLNRKPRAALEARLGSIKRQELLTSHHLELAVEALSQSLVSGQVNWTTFGGNAAKIESDIRRQLKKIVGNDLTARETRSALNESLIQIDMQRLILARRLDGLLFDLCDTVGCDLDQMLNAPPAPE